MVTDIYGAARGHEYVLLFRCYLRITACMFWKALHVATPVAPVSACLDVFCYVAEIIRVYIACYLPAASR